MTQHSWFSASIRHFFIVACVTLFTQYALILLNETVSQSLQLSPAYDSVVVLVINLIALLVWYQAIRWSAKQCASSGHVSEAKKIAATSAIFWGILILLISYAWVGTSILTDLIGALVGLLLWYQITEYTISGRMASHSSFKLTR